MRFAYVLIAALALPGTTWADTATYRYDTVHSQVVFSVTHNGFSRPFGRLPIADGVLRFDDADWSRSSTELTIDLSKVDMGDDAWNKAVRGSDLLAADTSPRARFVSTGVERRGDSDGVLHGNLTLRGITHPIDIAFRLNRVGRTIYGLHTVAGFSGTTTLDRTVFGMTGNPNSIGQSVAVWIEAEAIRTDEKTPSASSPKEAAHGATQ
ncbi:polyisoprenoid-binding protein YceI [Luteibacter rhizovicinus]|uniref:Polyisoprenoid-binding protein YceI n=1 Tax=Luteibacter rhizovicinus TaxID=242606 RepID=A0A4R3YT46_9GAMM|nr:YceI family protein [Luteibacter rhizovicinus]TCV95691.1 polyisoprenoid-binding protein YceI [Luteibacter rhizovicinus]